MRINANNIGSWRVPLRTPGVEETTQLLEASEFKMISFRDMTLKNEAGPQAQLPKDKSNAGVTSPTLQLPSPETNIISY